MISSLRRYLPRRRPRLGRFPRLCAVGICLLLAAQSAAADRPSRSPGTPTAAVLVSARALPAGHVLTAPDLRRARWPATERPRGAPTDVAAVVGHRLAGPVGAGEPILPTRLVGRDLATALPEDLVAAAVPLADAHAVELVRPGDRVELLSTQRTDDVSTPVAGTTATVVREARVLAVLAGADESSAPELVIAVPRSVATRIVRDEPSHVFTAVLAPP